MPPLPLPPTLPPLQEALKLLQTLLAHEPFACKLDAGAMLTSQCELEARLKVCVGEEGEGEGTLGRGSRV